MVNGKFRNAHGTEEKLARLVSGNTLVCGQWLQNGLSNFAVVLLEIPRDVAVA